MLPFNAKNRLNRQPVSDSISLKVRRLGSPDEEIAYPLENGSVSSWYEIIWILKGHGKHWLNLEKREITDQVIFCIRPEQWHKLEADDNTEGFLISFDESFLGLGEQEVEANYRTALIEAFERPRTLIADPDTARDMQEVVERMLREFSNIDLFRNELLRPYLKVFLVYLARQSGEVIQDECRKKKTIELVSRFFNLLNRDFGINKMVGSYARQLFVTPNYLNEMVKKSTGYPAGYHIRQRIVFEAKRMVAYSNITTKEVAYALGFSDVSHFSRFFKQNAGVNFSDFRRANYMYSDIPARARLYQR